MFYGLSDEARETWAETEQKALETCNTKLDMQISSLPIQRAHRIGNYKPGKTRVIIVHLLRYKVKKKHLTTATKASFQRGIPNRAPAYNNKKKQL